MPSSSTIRLQIEAVLASRFPSALTQAPMMIRPIVPTGVMEVDALLEGGFPAGAITELAGPECSGKTSLALSFLARITRTGSVGAWIDVSNVLHPESAAAAGVVLDRLLWVRCGATAGQVRTPDTYRFALPEKYMVPATPMKGLHGGGCGGHPRKEVKGLAESVGGLLRTQSITPRCAEPQRRERIEYATVVPPLLPPALPARLCSQPVKPWPRIEQALRVTDLLLQAGGFSAVVLDLGSIVPEFASRIPLASWFRYRAAAERAQVSLVALTQHSCAKSSAELLLRFLPSNARDDEKTVFTGMEYHMEVERRRFTQFSSNVVPLRKPPLRATGASWHSQTAWAGAR